MTKIDIRDLDRYEQEYRGRQKIKRRKPRKSADDYETPPVKNKSNRK